MKTGSYNGDGAVTQAIVGVGFQPRHVWIIQQASDVNSPTRNNDRDGVNAFFFWRLGGCHRTQSDLIISLDADGFTVGDGSVFGVNSTNILGQVYTYVCFN